MPFITPDGVVVSSVLEDLCLLRISCVNCVLTPKPKAALLVKVGGGGNVFWNRRIRQPNTVDLDGEKYRDINRIKGSSELNYGRSAEALTIEHDANGGALHVIYHAVVVRIESGPDEFQRYVALVVTQGFHVDTGGLLGPKFQGKLSNTTVLIIPSFPCAKKSEDDRISRADRGRLK
jgi:hypothetical protein